VILGSPPWALGDIREKANFVGNPLTGGEVGSL